MESVKASFPVPVERFPYSGFLGKKILRYGLKAHRHKCQYWDCRLLHPCMRPLHVYGGQKPLDLRCLDVYLALRRQTGTPVEDTAGKCSGTVAAVVFAAVAGVVVQIAVPVQPLYSVAASSSVLEGLICPPLRGLRSRMVNLRSGPLDGQALRIGFGSL